MLNSAKPRLPRFRDDAPKDNHHENEVTPKLCSAQNPLLPHSSRSTVGWLEARLCRSRAAREC
jgi:hypothetical protein